MPNLTETEKVVIKKSGEITLEDGYDLVVKQDKKFNYYPEGQLPEKKGWLSFKKSEPEEVFAVTTDDRHEIKFKKAVAHADGVHQFFVNINLIYGVDDPLAVVRQLRRDPVERLKEEAGKVISGFLRTANWEEIRNPDRFQKLKASALETVITKGRNDVVPMFDRIADHGRNYGLRVHEINFDVLISEKDLQVEIAEDKNKAEKLISDTDTDKNLHVTKNKQQEEVLDNEFRRTEEIKDQLAKTASNFIDRAGSNLAESSRSIDDVKKILSGAREIQQEIQAGTEGGQLSAGSATNTPLLGTGNSSLSSLEDVITQIKLANLDVVTQKKVLGALFHMVAGKMLEEPHDDLTKYALLLNGVELPIDLQDYLKSKWTEVKSRIEQNNIM